MLNTFLVIASFAAIWFVVKSLFWQAFFKTKESKPDGLLEKARLWLEENGYDILDVASKATYTSYFDDTSMRYEERAQVIARKQGHEYAVFVRTDLPTEEEIHQKFFPLYLILGVQGLIFLNLSEESVHHVDFSVSRSRRYRMRQWIRRGCWFMGGAVFAFAWVHRM